MTDNLPTAPSRQAIARKGASQPGRVTGKLRTALMRIIELGEEFDQAAAAAGLRTHSVRVAMQKAHVISWMKRQREVFRAYVAGQNIHHAKKMRDQSPNAIAALGAMKLIEQIGEQPPPITDERPGLVIVVLGAQGEPAPKVIGGTVIDVKAEKASAIPVDESEGATDE